MFFLLFLLDDRRIRILSSDERIQVQEAQKHTSGSATLALYVKEHTGTLLIEYQAFFRCLWIHPPSRQQAVLHTGKKDIDISSESALIAGGGGWTK
jgi:hypothetical protein